MPLSGLYACSGSSGENIVQRLSRQVITIVLAEVSNNFCLSIRQEASSKDILVTVCRRVILLRFFWFLSHSTMRSGAYSQGQSSFQQLEVAA